MADLSRSSYRFDSRTLDDIDAIVRYLSERDGRPVPRADAIRYAARDVRRRLEKKSGKSAHGA